MRFINLLLIRVSEMRFINLLLIRVSEMRFINLLSPQATCPLPHINNHIQHITWAGSQWETPYSAGCTNTGFFDISFLWVVLISPRINIPTCTSGCLLSFRLAR